MIERRPKLDNVLRFRTFEIWIQIESPKSAPFPLAHISTSCESVVALCCALLHSFDVSISYLSGFHSPFILRLSNLLTICRVCEVKACCVVLCKVLMDFGTSRPWAVRWWWVIPDEQQPLRKEERKT